MKKILIIFLITIALIGCEKKDELALGKYEERNYINENFNLDFEVPEDFSFYNSEELLEVNKRIASESANPEAAKYRNLVLNVEHIDGTKLIGFVDAHPTSQKNKLVEANNFLDFLSAQNVTYEFEKGEKEINGVNYLELDLVLPFDELQKNYITVINNKLINIQINYKIANSGTAEALLSLYE